jgi:hypothetical protein
VILPDDATPKPDRIFGKDKVRKIAAKDECVELCMDIIREENIYADRADRAGDASAS